ncbi:hypothetical protein GJ699_08005 [Duganella sp. FT80W]|uniref:Lipoprotein n=1 Tax=Duganella guangzhouensis TaxID=2666084 RepID=A0A6I2KVT6_9BURK|nr:hypothetical protein [Duganella guangzhouensis]MRW89923.1 hypothetical protein [Duganella guangzhouensis]
MKRLTIALLAGACMLAGCATEYHPLNSEGGYSEKPLGPGVWQVKIDSSPYTHARLVQDFSLLRSAELTLQQGYSSFGLSASDSAALVLSGQPAQAVPPGPDLLVRMSHQPADSKRAIYDARVVCAQLGSYYEVTCAPRSN